MTIRLSPDEIASIWQNGWGKTLSDRLRSLIPSNYKKVKVHFENREHMDAFGRLIGQKLTEKTRVVYWPPEDAED